MSFFLIFLAEFCFLLAISKLLVENLTKALFILTKSRSATVSLVALLFFPGVVVHELAHLLTAGILFVPVGHMILTPKIEDNGQVRLGSVAIAKTDPIRRMVIGIAPMIFGLVIIMAVPYWAMGKLSFAFGALVIYLLFVVGNTMFSSNKDLEGVLEILVVIALLVLVMYLTKFLGPFYFFRDFLSSATVASFFKVISSLLLWTIGIDIGSLILSSIFLKSKGY